jgi:hypothetical protein
VAASASPTIREWRLPQQGLPAVDPSLQLRVPARFAIEDDSGHWIEEASNRPPIGTAAGTSAPAVSQPTPALAASAASSSRSAQQAHQTAAVATPATLQSAAQLPQPGARRPVSEARKTSLASAHRLPIHGGIVKYYTYNTRVSHESTDRLNRHKAMLDRLDANALLALPANFTIDELRDLLAANGMTLDPELRKKSAMDAAHNLIFYTVCRMSNPRQNATVDELRDHIERIVAMPAADRAKIASWLDISRTLLASTGLASSFEAVRKAIKAYPSLHKLPVYA